MQIQLSYGMTGWVQFTKHGIRTNYTLYIMQLQPGGSLKQIGIFKSPHEREPRMSVLLDPVIPKPIPIDMDDWKHKVNRVTTIKVWVESS